MTFKMVSVAVLALVVGVGAATAQSARDFGGPAELPPSSYKGQQYVDSRGCLFLRAGIGGQTTWVPRVSRSRKQLCNQPPSGREVAVAEDAPAIAPRVAAAQPSSRKPLDTVASITTAPRIRAAAPQPQQRVVAAPVYAPVAAPQPSRTLVSPNAPSGIGAERVPTVAGNRKIGCYEDAPVAERFAVRGGGSVVMCTRGDGDLANARAPLLPGGRSAVAASGYAESGSAGRTTEQRRAVLSTQDVSKPPKGYKNAWGDDRLNPKRGQGTRQGWNDQDGIWTRDVPAQLVQDVVRKQVKKGGKVHLSSKSEGTAPAVRSGRSYIQVGTFGQPSNAEGASNRLAGLGLPVARQKITKGGKALQIVMAGPFGSGAEAQAALRAARNAGFSDAFIR